MTNETAAKIDEILREVDPEGFCAQGAPSDEYASEARAIASGLHELAAQADEKTVAALIAMIWAKQFKLSPQQIEQRLPAFRQIAVRILAG